MIIRLYREWIRPRPDPFSAFFELGEVRHNTRDLNNGNMQLPRGKDGCNRIDYPQPWEHPVIHPEKHDSKAQFEKSIVLATVIMYNLYQERKLFSMYWGVLKRI